MSAESLCIDDRRGLIFTINRESTPVYQVESWRWARAANRWNEADIPQGIREKVAELGQSGKPGAFVRFIQGDVGVYVIHEQNIKNVPELAGDDLALGVGAEPEGAPALAPYDIVICAKDGAVCADGGEVFQTHAGDYYVVKCDTWARFVLNDAMRPKFVETTKDVLLLLDDLHGKNFLSMSPDKPDETLPPDLPDPTAVPVGINCYVLNLSRFKR